MKVSFSISKRKDKCTSQERFYSDLFDLSQYSIWQTWKRIEMVSLLYTTLLPMVEWSSLSNYLFMRTGRPIITKISIKTCYREIKRGAFAWKAEPLQCCLTDSFHRFITNPDGLCINTHTHIFQINELNFHVEKVRIKNTQLRKRYQSNAHAHAHIYSKQMNWIFMWKKLG